MALSPLAHGQEKSNWISEFSEGPFHIHCDFRIADSALRTASAASPEPQSQGPHGSKEALISELQGIGRDLWKFLRVSAPKEKIHIVLFEKESEYRRYMRNYFPEVPDRRAIFLQDRGPGMLFAHWHPDIAIDLRHEVTHALLNDQAQRLPLWLDEGLAEYFENPEHARFQASPYILQVQQDLQNVGIPTIIQLQRLHSIEELSQEDYRHSWAWVHFMIHRSADTRLVLIRYLESLRNPNSPPFDLERALRSVTPQLELELQHHFKNLRSPATANLAAKPTNP